MTDDLSALPEGVREAVRGADRAFRHEGLFAEPYWKTVRAELLRLTRENAELRFRVHAIDATTYQDALAVGRAERAEAELAVLKAEMDQLRADAETGKA